MSMVAALTAPPVGKVRPGGSSGQIQCGGLWPECSCLSLSYTFICPPPSHSHLDMTPPLCCRTATFLGGRAKTPLDLLILVWEQAYISTILSSARRLLEVSKASPLHLSEI